MSKPERISATPPDELFDRIVAILERARGNVVRAVNTNMVLAYWLIGREIVEEVQRGQERATYGKKVIETLSTQLTARYGRGFSEQSLQNFRRFYLAYPDRCQISSPLGRESTEIPISSPAGRELMFEDKRHQKDGESSQGFLPQLS